MQKDSRKKFCCQQCQKIVKVPLKYLGKRIKCPKCSFVFRAGPKPTEESEIIAELDEEADLSLPLAAFVIPTPDYGIQPPLAASQVPPANVPEMATPYALPSSRPANPTPYRSKMAKQRRSQKNEMTEFDTNLQSSGIFLLILPIIATVLPLAGLQLRRLARLGEFAPLGAMVAGLIGVGMICYARRNQGDAPVLGSAAAVFVLFSGIGGFFMVAALAPSQEDSSDRYSNRPPRNEPSNNLSEAMARTKASHENIAQETRRDREDFHQRIRDQHDQMRAESDRIMRQAEEHHRRAMENMHNDIPTLRGAPQPSFGGFGGRRN